MHYGTRHETAGLTPTPTPPVPSLTMTTIKGEIEDVVDYEPAHEGEEEEKETTTPTPSEEATATCATTTAATTTATTTAAAAVPVITPAPTDPPGVSAPDKARSSRFNKRGGCSDGRLPTSKRSDDDNDPEEGSDRRRQDSG